MPFPARDSATLPPIRCFEDAARNAELMENRPQHELPPVVLPGVRDLNALIDHDEVEVGRRQPQHPYQLVPRATWHVGRNATESPGADSVVFGGAAPAAFGSSPGGIHTGHWIDHDPEDSSAQTAISSAATTSTTGPIRSRLSSSRTSMHSNGGLAARHAALAAIANRELGAASSGPYPLPASRGSLRPSGSSVSSSSGEFVVKSGSGISASGSADMMSMMGRTPNASASQYHSSDIEYTSTREQLKIDRLRSLLERMNAEPTPPSTRRNSDFGAAPHVNSSLDHVRPPHSATVRGKLFRLKQAMEMLK